MGFEKKQQRKIMKILFLFLLVSFSVFAESKLTLNVQLNPAGSFQATSEKLKGDLVKKNGVFSAEKIVVKVETLKTGMDLRDEHFWKHMNYTKYAEAILSNLVGQNGKATAQLEVAGVKKSVQISYKEDGSTIVGQFKVLAHDFKLPQAEYLGIGVEDEVEGEVKMTFKSI
jgi:hypothetical protein